jgi:hypothetical protein
MESQPSGQGTDVSKDESYSHAKDFHSIEISTLNERTNFFLITQSIFI